MHVILAHSSARIGKSTALSRKYSSTIGAHVSGIISSPELETIDGGPDDGSTINVWLNLIEIASISIDDEICMHGTGITVSRMSPTTQLHLLCPEVHINHHGRTAMLTTRTPVWQHRLQELM